MKIVALHTDFRIYWPARLHELNNVLKQRGDELTVIEIAGKGSPYAFARKTEVCLDWVVLFPDNSPEHLQPSFIKVQLFKVLNELMPDVIIAGATAFPSGALAVQWGLMRGAKVITFDDAKCEAVKRNLAVEFIKKSVYRGVDAMIYPAPDWQSTGIYWGFENEQLFYGLDVVDNIYWAKPAKESISFGHYFVSVGRQIKKKNHMTIVKAYAKYRQSVGIDAYDLVLIGEGPEHEKLVKFVSEANLENCIHLLPFFTQEELPAIYQHAKALISSGSSSETWGLVINEAMAGGCPIIASVECGATNTLVKDGVNGYRFSCDDQEQLVKLMIKFHQLGFDRQNSMREASRKIISNWGLSRFANTCVSAIDYVAQHKKRKTTWLDCMLIRLWMGRYRPV